MSIPVVEPLNGTKTQLKIFIDKIMHIGPRDVKIEIIFVNGILTYKITSKTLSNNEASSLSVQCPTVESMHHLVEDKNDYWVVTITKAIATPVASPDASI